MLSLSKEILNYLEHSNISSKKPFMKKNYIVKILALPFHFGVLTKIVNIP
jgi:hypothetical protein